MATRSIANAGPSTTRPGSYGFSAASISAASVGGDLDPVINIDHFRMRMPTFPPHPHAGFSAVSYLFDDSEVEFENHDSLGHSLLAKPGAIIWSVAGRGMMHEEFPHVRGKLAHGLQVFVNLAAAAKLEPPRILFADGPAIPIVEHGGARTRVVAGSVGDVRGAIEPPGDITFLDIKLDPGATFEQPVEAERSALAYVIEGDLLGGAERRALATLDAATFAPDGDRVVLRAGTRGARVVLIAGRPLREPVVSNGPFVMNDREQIASAIERYRSGGMGRLESST